MEASISSTKSSRRSLIPEGGSGVWSRRLVVSGMAPLPPSLSASLRPTFLWWINAHALLDAKRWLTHPHSENLWPHRRSTRLSAADHIPFLVPLYPPDDSLSDVKSLLMMTGSHSDCERSALLSKNGEPTSGLGPLTS